MHLFFGARSLPPTGSRAAALLLFAADCVSFLSLGGYHADSPPVRWFWQVLAEYPPPRRAAALKFATSCSRPPLMGFGWLQPPFCIHLAAEPRGGDTHERN